MDILSAVMDRIWTTMDVHCIKELYTCVVYANPIDGICDEQKSLLC